MRFPTAALASLLAVASVGAVRAATAATVDAYREEMRLAADGTAAVTIRVETALPAGTALRLPFGHPRVERATLAAAAGVAPALETLEGGLMVLTATVPPQGAVEVRFREGAAKGWKKVKPFGNRVFAYDLVNAAGTPIGRYEGTFLLPEGELVNSVVETLPEDSETSASRPYEFVRVDGLNGIRLRAAPLGPATDVRAVFRFKPARRPGPLLVGVALLAAVWLVRFRDLPRRTP